MAWIVDDDAHTVIKDNLIVAGAIGASTAHKLNGRRVWGVNVNLIRASDPDFSRNQAHGQRSHRTLTGKLSTLSTLSTESPVMMPIIAHNLKFENLIYVIFINI
jgi:hypothetical protein